MTLTLANNWPMRGATPQLMRHPCVATLFERPFVVWHAPTQTFRVPDEPGPAYLVVNRDGTQAWVGVAQFESSYGVAGPVDISKGMGEEFWRAAELVRDLPCDRVISEGGPGEVDLHEPHVVRRLKPIWAKQYSGPEITVPTNKGPMTLRNGDFLCESDASYQHRTTGEGEAELDIWPVAADLLSASYKPEVALIKRPEAPGRRGSMGILEH